MSENIFKLVWRGWKKVAHKIMFVQTRIILFLFYSVILGITSVLLRSFRVNMLGESHRSDPSFWRAKESLDETSEGLGRQF